MKTIKVIIGVLSIIQANYCVAQNEEVMKDYSIEIIRYTISKDQSVAFEEAYKKAGLYLQESPYCRGYHVLRGDEEPGHYIVTIYWTSKEDHLSRFRSSEQFTNFLSLVRPYYNNIDEMKHYQATSTSWSAAPDN